MKLLVYGDECDVAFGTRTTRELICAGANMEWFRAGATGAWPS